jgi:hypothetical protein
MPTFRHGKGSAFRINDVAGTSRDISNTIEEVSFPREIEAAETSTFGTSAKTYIAGLSDSKITVSGKFDATASTGPDIIFPAMIAAQATQTVTASGGNDSDSNFFQFGPEGSTTGRVRYSGKVIVTNYEVGAPVGDIVSYSVELQVNGAVTRDTSAFV